MKLVSNAPDNIDDYISGFPRKIQTILQKVRATIKNAAPGAEEVISYRMPAFALKGNLVYFAAFKKHIGLFPPITGDEKLRQEAAVYAGPKGNLRFPFAEPIPYALITKIVKLRVKENLKNAKAKQKNT